MKKWFAVLLSVVTALSTLAGCAGKKVLARCISALIIMSMLFSSTSVLAQIPEETQGTESYSEIVPENIALNSTYTYSYAPDSSKPDDTSKKMTDGQTAGATMYSSYWVGFLSSNDDLSITIDLGKEESFNQISLGAFAGEGGITFPQKIKIDVSSDNKTWKPLSYDELSETVDAPTRKDYVYVGSVLTQYIKVTIGYNGWLYLDEIQIWDQSFSQPNLTPAKPVINPDPNNLAFQLTYNTTWEASADYSDSGKKELTDGKKSNKLNIYDPLWAGYYDKTSELGDFYITMNLPENGLTFKQITMNFLKGTSGVVCPKSVTIQTSEDNVIWTDLSNEEIVDNGELGIRNYVYTTVDEKPVTTKYIRFIIDLNTWLFIDEIQILAEPSSSGGGETGPDDQESVNLVSSLKPITNNVSISGSLSSLTDEDTNSSVSFTLIDEGNNGEIVFDLGASNSVSDILVAFTDNKLPETVDIQVSNSGTKWSSIKEYEQISGSDIKWNAVDDRSHYNSTIPDANMIYCSHIKLVFSPTAENRVDINEIKVIGKLGLCSKAGTVFAVNNLSATKPYTINFAASGAYPDTNFKELTDTITGGSSIWDSSWQGHCGEWPNRQIILDLQEESSITDITANFLAETAYTVNLPTYFKIYVSIDNKNWAPVYSNNKIVNENGIKSIGWHSTDTTDEFALTKGKPIVAKYVRLDFELNGWTFIDEIEVLGSKGQLDGAVILDPQPIPTGEFMKPSAGTSYIQDMFLAYNGAYINDEGIDQGEWKKEDFKPYLTYIDTNGKSKDTMFDAALFLALESYDGSLFIECNGDLSKASDARDWNWYLDKTFKKNGDIYNLNKAAKQAARDLKKKDYKIKVVITIPFPDPLQSNFGSVNGSENLDFSNQTTGTAAMIKALDWYIEEVMSRWENGNYSYLELCGLYWMNETDYKSELIKYSANKIQEINAAKNTDLNLFWIPYYNAGGWNRWEQMGIDAVTLQPNHFFSDGSLPGDVRIEQATTLAKMYNMGIEFEMDSRAFSEVNRYNKYLDYLNGSVKYGYSGGNTCFRNWYNGLRDLSRAAYANEPKMEGSRKTIRSLYDYTYQVIKGTYEAKPYITSILDEKGD